MGIRKILITRENLWGILAGFLAVGYGKLNTRKLNTENSTQKTQHKVNKMGTSKVGAISKAQKTQKTFFKKLEIFDFFLSENVA